MKKQNIILAMATSISLLSCTSNSEIAALQSQVAEQAKVIELYQNYATATENLLDSMEAEEPIQIGDTWMETDTGFDYLNSRDALQKYYWQNLHQKDFRKH